MSTANADTGTATYSTAGGADLAVLPTGHPASIHLLDLDLEVPSIGCFEDFHRWALSLDFPETGRIDYIAGRLEIDMSPEDMYLHAVLKTEISSALVRPRVPHRRTGLVVSDSMRYSCPQATLSVEPDVIWVSYESLRSGRAKRIRKAHSDTRYVELEGAVDLVVEIVSDKSVRKDTVQLREAYYCAGVEEYWLADARGDELVFAIHQRGATGFEPVMIGNDGFQHSSVLGCRFRLVRDRDELGDWHYEMLERVATS